MATIPLPALDLRPPAPAANPLEQYGQALQLKNLMQNAPLQTQAMQQQVQAGALDVQQKQQALKDQQAMTAGMQQWDGKDYNDLPALVLKSGGSATAVFGLKQKINEQLLQQSTTLKNNGDAALAQATAAQKKGDLITGALAPLVDPKQTPDAQLPQALQASVQDLTQRGLLDPQHAAAATQLLQSSGGDSTVIRNGIDQFRKTFLAQSQIMDDAMKQAGVNKDVAETSEANATTAKTQAETGYYAQHGGAPGVPAEQQQMNDWLAKNPGKGPSDYGIAMKKIVPAFNFNLQNQGIGPGPGGQPSALAQMVASDASKWNEVITNRTPQSVKEAFAKEVLAINPKFNTGTFGLQQQAAEKATSGSWADTRLAYNTALDHSQLLLDSAAALQNGDIKKLNSLQNAFKSQFGSSGPITFDAVANAYNHEVTSVISKGHMTDNEVQTGGATLPSNANLSTIQSVVGAYKSLMTSKRNELDKIIKAGAGNKADSVLGVGSDSGGNQPDTSKPLTITLGSGRTISIQ